MEATRTWIFTGFSCDFFGQQGWVADGTTQGSTDIDRGLCFGDYPRFTVESCGDSFHRDLVSQDCPGGTGLDEHRNIVIQ